MNGMWIRLAVAAKEKDCNWQVEQSIILLSWEQEWSDMFTGSRILWNLLIWPGIGSFYFSQD